jgi:hypothetical protein
MDLWLEGFALFNFVCLSGDIALAHSENGFRLRAEYFPIWFSLASVVFLFAGLILRLRLGQTSAWAFIGHGVGWASIAIGTAGVVYHLESRFFYERTLKSLTYTAPFGAPVAFVGLGCLLIMNRMVEARSREWARWVLFFALGGFIGNFVLSLTDHAVNGFFVWEEWIPVVSSAFAVAFLTQLIARNPDGWDLLLTALVLVIQVFVGGLGFLLHLLADVHGPAEKLLPNIIHGAPPFAPLLLPNLALLGLLGLAAMARDHTTRT